MAKMESGDSMKHSNLYTRKRIMTLLRKIEDYPVTVLVASTGYGKTTAVHQYLTQISTRHLYLNITSPSEKLFWNKLCEGLNSFAPLAAQALRLNGLPEDDLKRAADIDVLKKMLPESLILVLDDCQLLPTGGQIFKFLAALTLENLSGFYLVLLSQKLPPIRVGTLVFKDRCLLVERETLAFTPEETKGYLESRGLHLAPEVVAEIYKQSCGWISVLFFISEAFLHGRLDYHISSLNQMFEENFLLTFNADEREMLTRLSALGKFTTDLVIAATGNRRSNKILSQLERNNAFITCDKEGWYRFHSLLKAYLIVQCPQDKEQKEFYLRAGHWYLKQKRYYQALKLYRLAGQTEQFVREMDTVNHWSRDCRTILTEMAPELKLMNWTRNPGSFLEVAFALLRTGKDTSSRLGYQILKTVALVNKNWTQLQ